MNQLTKREKEVLQLVVKRLPTNEIAHRLGLTPYTVDTYRKNIIKKLEIKHPFDWVRFAIRMGIICDPTKWACTDSDPRFLRRNGFKIPQEKSGFNVRWILIGVPVPLIIWSLALWATQWGV